MIEAECRLPHCCRPFEPMQVITGLEENPMYLQKERPGINEQIGFC